MFAGAVVLAGLLGVAACLVAVAAGLGAVAAPPCHANAVDDSKMAMSSAESSVASRADNNP